MVNKEIYTDELAKGVEDKLFFDDLDLDILIDFGCADGQVSQYIADQYDITVYGYDVNNDLLPDTHTNNTVYFNSWENLIRNLRPSQTIGIYFSSVLHEIYSFNQIDDVKYKINQYDFDYIIIRDMHVTDEDKKICLEESDIMNVMDSVNLRLVNHFVCTHSPVMLNGGMIHFLMKHRFAYNWDYEIQENYLAITDERLNWWKSLGKVILENHYTLPYYQDVFESRYDFILNTPTHIKLIIDCNEYL